MSNFFPDARDFSIDGGTFSIIHGDQTNYYCQRTSRASETSTSTSTFASGIGPMNQETSSATTTVFHINGNQINHLVQQEEKEHTEFDDFRNLKRGDICRLRDVCHVLRRCEYHWHQKGCQCSCEVIKTVGIAKLIGTDGEFTVVSYRGQDARKVFEEEFQKLSRQLLSEVAQIYAIDDGTIPSMVLWHDLIPISQFAGNVGELGRQFLAGLSSQWGCTKEELWMDPSKGLICRGPLGPESTLTFELEFDDGLPPTAEHLHEGVLVRFLASHKADDVFMTAIYYARNFEDVPEHVHRPTIFSAQTKTPIAVANNAWRSGGGNLVERTCLENGLIRFRLNGDGWLELDCNWDIQKAWLSQAWSVFYAHGVSLEDDLGDFNLIYPDGRLEGSLDDSLSKCKLRQRQPIYLFVYSPPSDLHNGNTFSLHHWSFQEDGNLQITPESCYNLGLPVELYYYDEGCICRSWSTDSYKSLHQYKFARGFDPTTADFTRHLGYGNYNFQPFDDSDHFEEVHKGQISPFFISPADLGRLINTTNSGDSSENTQHRRWAVNTTLEGKRTTSSDHNVPNKWCRTDLGSDGIEVRNSQHHDLHHKNDPTHEANHIMDVGLRLIQPLPTGSLPFTINPQRCVEQGTSTSTFHPSEYSPFVKGVSPQHPPLPTNLSLTDLFPLCNMKSSTSTTFDLLSLLPQVIEQPLHVSHTTALDSFDIESLFNSYSVSENVCSISDPIPSTTDSPYRDPSAYSVSTTTTTGYEPNAAHGLGWSRNGQCDIRNYDLGPLFVAPNNINSVFGLSPASTSTFAYPPHSIAQGHTHSPYPLYGRVPPPSVHSSSFPYYGGGSLGPQHERNRPLLHSQQPPVLSHSWAVSMGMPLCGQSESG
ncbi:hypothetical protein PQX77_012576 [Marasmius sp. AFHP31]|nr:hypothetical protein PQX77_012576 [Marasmius sp. AFHP31]